ncbi:MAG: sigma-70 family RNA polymerase sigma factor [Phycisphaera sp.]|nr:sigma-70 family RNA polymerase sigma factor [Phycisphaera sp.]
MEGFNANDQFVQQLINFQPRLRGYIRLLLPNRAMAEDVLQETNLVLWRKAEDFEPGTNFGAWACRVAYYQALAQRQKIGREKLVFDDELVGDLASEAERQTGMLAESRSALQVCMDQLNTTHREMLDRRYAFGDSVNAIAERLGRPVGSVKQTLYRIRTTLGECIEQRLTAEGQA